MQGLQARTEGAHDGAGGQGGIDGVRHVAPVARGAAEQLSAVEEARQRPKAQPSPAPAPM